mmetsp:Transcript_33620/g.81332  ORF Transcript_33620/g.81332 Transcript_33620/m.81332 type:complete len:154 (+) Transcript_33620:19-480(+)
MPVVQEWRGSWDRYRRFKTDLSWTARDPDAPLIAVGVKRAAPVVAKGPFSPLAPAVAPKPKKLKFTKADPTLPNAALVDVFEELAEHEFALDKFKAVAYRKVAASLRNSGKITSGKEATKLPGIGKVSGEKIDEFLLTGKVDKLERLRMGITS